MGSERVSIPNAKSGFQSEAVGSPTRHVVAVTKMEVLEGELAPIGEISLR